MVGPFRVYRLPFLSMRVIVNGGTPICRERRADMYSQLRIILISSCIGMVLLGGSAQAQTPVPAAQTRRRHLFPPHRKAFR